MEELNYNQEQFLAFIKAYPRKSPDGVMMIKSKEFIQGLQVRRKTKTSRVIQNGSNKKVTEITEQTRYIKPQSQHVRLALIALDRMGYIEFERIGPKVKSVNKIKLK